MTPRVTTVLSLALLAVFYNLVLVVNSAPNSDLVKEEVFCEKDGVKHKPGDTWPAPLGDCYLYHCRPDGTIYIIRCPVYEETQRPNCVIPPHNITLPYPECCPKWRCPENLPPPTLKPL